MTRDNVDLKNFEAEDEAYRRERRKRQEMRKRKETLRKKRRRRRIMALLTALVLVVLLGIGIARLVTSMFSKVMVQNPLVRSLTVEVGTEVVGTDFLEDKDSELSVTIVTDMSEISKEHVGKYTITLEVEEKTYKVVLFVEDTVAPVATTQTVTISSGSELTAEELLTSVTDLTDVTISYKTTPDYSSEGTINPIVVLEDEGGNITEITCEVIVIYDDEAPVIDGVAPLTAFIGVPVSYKANVTVTDNYDENVSIKVDTGDVNADEEGTYTVVYSATDWAGNTTEVATTITFSEKPEDYIEEDVVLAEAAEVLEKITTEDMTLKEIAQAIYDWARANISYVSTSEKNSWTNGAHQGFTTGSGDCFIYFATTKALLTQAGIPNIDVVKSDTSHSSHYWSLIDVGDGWYHFDATPRKGGGDFFLLTDEEILAYSESHSNSHIFDQSLYPATPTVASSVE